MTFPPNAPQGPLIRVGFTHIQISALRLAWDSPALGYLLNGVASAIHEQGGRPEDALDFIEHGHDAASAGFYFNHGFSAHQARIIDADPKAKDNLWDRHTGGADDVLAHPAPHTFIVDVLRTAASPDEVDHHLRRYQEVLDKKPTATESGTDTTASLEAELRSRAALKPYVGITCSCQ